MKRLKASSAKQAVLVDRVIIDNSGRDETLMLEGIEYKSVWVVSEPALPAPLLLSVVTTQRLQKKSLMKLKGR